MLPDSDAFRRTAKQRELIAYCPPNGEVLSLRGNIRGSGLRGAQSARDALQWVLTQLATKIVTAAIPGALRAITNNWQRQVFELDT